MVTVRVNRGFADLLHKVDRSPGEEFAATEERAEQLMRKLPSGFVEVVGKEASKAEAPSKDLSRKTVAELTAIARERGIAVPSKPKKAELLTLLKE